MKLNCEVCGKESSDGILKDRTFKCDECYEEGKVYCSRCKERVPANHEYERVPRFQLDTYSNDSSYKCTTSCKICLYPMHIHYENQNGEKYESNNSNDN